MELQTARLTIREVGQEIAQEYADFDNGNVVQENLAALSAETLMEIMGQKEYLQNLLAKMEEIAHSEDKQYFGAFLNDNLIGCITLINLQSDYPELQIVLAEAYRGQGYGYEFLQSVLQELFEKQPNMTIQYTVAPTNERSLALVRKIGGRLQPSMNPVESFFIQRYHFTAPSGVQATCN